MTEPPRGAAVETGSGSPRRITGATTPVGSVTLAAVCASVTTVDAGNVATSPTVSAGVAALVGALAGYVSQQALAARDARLNYEFLREDALYEALGRASKDLLRRVGQH